MWTVPIQGSHVSQLRDTQVHLWGLWVPRETFHSLPLISVSLRVVPRRLLVERTTVPGIGRVQGEKTVVETTTRESVRRVGLPIHVTIPTSVSIHQRLLDTV